MRQAKFPLVLMALITCLFGHAWATTYYVDPGGDDGNPGTDAASPWQTLTKVNQTTFNPGDEIRFKAGGSWAGELWPKGSGDGNAPIVLGSYGAGAKPVIDAQGVADSAAIKLHNQEYWIIQDMEVHNWSDTAIRAVRRGISITADDGTVKHGIHVLNNTVKDIYGTPIRSGSPSFYDVAGIYIRISEPGRADDVLIEGNALSNIVAQGIAYWGETEFVGGGMNWDNLSTRVVVRGNTVSHTAADGIMIIGTDNELVEYNTVGYVGELGVVGTDYVAGMWPSRHKDGLWQFNEVHHTRRWSGDGEAFDNDGVLRGVTIFQYNYSHDNYGFLLDIAWDYTGGPDEGHTVARYNISVNDAEVLQSKRGNALIHNNVFYSPGRTLFVDGLSSNIFRNNIFVASGSAESFDSQIFSHNLFYGGIAVPAGDANGLSADPKFISANINGSLDGFKLQTDSPCIVSGILIDDNGGRDYFGAPVADDGAPNRGADNIQTPEAAQAVELAVTGFPNPQAAGMAGSVTVTAKNAYGGAAAGYTGTVVLTSSDGAAVLPGSYTFVSSDAGSKTFAATLNTAGTHSITATDTVTAAITGTQQDITVVGPVSGGRTVIAFTSVGSTTWTVPAGVTSIELLVVGGGGAGGGAYGGGGGAGGLIYQESHAVTPAATVPITVGGGGSGQITHEGDPKTGLLGGNSSFGGLVALGGGYGAGNAMSGGGYAPGSGGSAGGLAGNSGFPAGIAQQPDSPSAGYGNLAGSGAYGGGGGAGSSGTGGTGGAGQLYSISGTPAFYAAGGAGLGASGGSQIGGNGSVSAGALPAAGAPNTGSGGGGAWAASGNQFAGGSGGSGIVIVSYAAAPPASPYANWMSGFPQVPAGQTGFGDDPNHDGVPNGLAWLLLGGAPMGDSRASLPVSTTTASTVSLEFTCLKPGEWGGAELQLQYGSDLDTWQSATVPGSNATLNSVEFTVTEADATHNLVIAEIPRSPAPGGKLFARLHAILP